MPIRPSDGPYFCKLCGKWFDRLSAGVYLCHLFGDCWPETLRSGRFKTGFAHLSTSFIVARPASNDSPSDDGCAGSGGGSTGLLGGDTQAGLCKAVVEVGLGVA